MGYGFCECQQGRKWEERKEMGGKSDEMNVLASGVCG